MTFKPPSSKHLQKATIDLQQRFNNLANRYIPPQYADLIDGIEKLESVYISMANCKKKKASNFFRTTGPDETRLEQIGFIRQLANNMPTIKSKDESKKEQALQILLGAIIHRCLRIKSSYVMSKSTNSALIVALEKLLGLQDQKSVVDVQTQVTCLTAFQDYLKRKGVADNYTYVCKNPLFFSDLEEMIVSATKKAKPINEQLQYIQSIQSIHQELIQCESEAIRLLSELSIKIMDALMKDTKVVGDEDIIKMFEALGPSNRMNQLFTEYFYPCKIASIEAENQENAINAFKKEIEGRISSFCLGSLLGMYILVLSKYPDKNSYLYRVLQVSINVNSDNPLDDATRDEALKSLKYYADLLESPIKQLEIWGGWEQFKSELDRQWTLVATLEEDSSVVLTL